MPVFHLINYSQRKGEIEEAFVSLLEFAKQTVISKFQLLYILSEHYIVLSDDDSIASKQVKRLDKTTRHT